MSGQGPSARSRFGLAPKLALGAGAVLLLVSMVVSLGSFIAVRRRSLIALQRQGTAIASTLNYSLEVLVPERDIKPVQRVVSNSALLPNVTEINVYDLDARIIASSDPAAVGRAEAPAGVRGLLARQSFRSEIEDREGAVAVLRPLFNGDYEHATKTGLTGVVEVILDRRAMEGTALALGLRLLGAQVSGYLLLSGLFWLVVRAFVGRPLRRMATAARRFREGDRAARSEVRSRDEIGTVSEAFDAMADEIAQAMRTLEGEVRARTADLEAEVEARGKALQALEQAHAELKAGVEERLRLAETIRALSTPVLKVHRDVLVMPLIGAIDPARAAQIQGALLDGIERHSARQVILDLTGVPTVDGQVAEALIRAKQGAELVGAEVVIVGMRAEVASSVVQAGIDLSRLVAHTNLQSGLAHALGRIGVVLGPGAQKRRPA